MIVSFTGHREIDLIVAEFNTLLVLGKVEPTYAIVGGAAGADTLAAEICAREGIPYTLALPHRFYAKQYKLLGDPRWQATVDRAAKVLTVVGDDKPWHFSANFKRNEWMVDNSDLLIAISTFDPYGVLPIKGGTAHCVRYALKVEREIRWAKT